MKLLGFVLTVLVSVGTASAQGDPPSRVARLNWINGAVSFQPAGVDTWTSATPNYPLTTGDHIYTDDRSRAELHVGPNALRLDAFSNMGFLNLDDRIVQVRFTEGSIEIRLRRLEDDDLYEIDTPQGAISLLRNGDYRIDTDPNRNATMLTIRGGEAEVTANGQSFAVHPRQTAYFSGDNPPEIQNANASDDFDRFVIDRNRMEDTPPQQEYVPRSMVGSEDLYRYGNWSDEPGYGRVWVPPTRVGWAPYREGRWAWVEPWGWTWIDDAPWGFAPFHYGRWAHADRGWIWVPGPVAVRPVYSPALVVFVGGAGVGVGVSWFPLGPREVYRPVYRTSPGYVNRVNITNVTNITNVNVTNVNVTNVNYVNRNVPGAVTSTSREAFVGRQQIRGTGQPMSPQQVSQLRVVGSAPQIAPQRSSLVGADSNVPRPRREVMARQVVARQTPPPPAVAFQARQRELERDPGRPVNAEAMQNLRLQQPQPVVAAPVVRPATQYNQATRPVAPRSFGEAPAVQQPRSFGQAPAVQQPRSFGQAPATASPVQSQPAQTQPQSREARPRDRYQSRPPTVTRPADAGTPPPAQQNNAERPTPPRSFGQAPIINQPQAAPQPRPAPQVTRPSEPVRPPETSRPAEAQRPRQEQPRVEQNRERPVANKSERPAAKKEEKKEEKPRPQPQQ